MAEAFTMAVGRAMIACPICGSDASKLCDREVDFIYRCKNVSCKHSYSYPQPNDNQLAIFYSDDYYNGSNDPRYRQTQHSIFRQILGWLPTVEGPILDVGCGLGYLFDVLPIVSKEHYVGVEVDKTSRKKAQQRIGRPIIENLTELADIGKCFKEIIMNQVIEHFRDPIASLRMLQQVSCDDTILFVATANSASLKARVRRCNWEELRNRTHLHLFTEASILLALQKGGWPKGMLIDTPIRYPHHGSFRYLFHRVLRRLKCDGNLTLIALRS